MKVTLPVLLIVFSILGVALTDTTTKPASTSEKPGSTTTNKPVTTDSKRSERTTTTKKPRTITANNKPVTATTTKKSVANTNKNSTTITTTNKPGPETAKKTGATTTKKSVIPTATKKTATSTTVKGIKQTFKKVYVKNKNKIQATCTFRIFATERYKGRVDLFGVLKYNLHRVSGLSYKSNSTRICCKESIFKSTELITVEKRTSKCCLLQGQPEPDGMRPCSYLHATSQFARSPPSPTKTNTDADAHVITQICADLQRATGKIKFFTKPPYLTGFTDQNNSCADQNKPYHIYFPLTHGNKFSLYPGMDWCCSKDIFDDYSLDPSKLCCGLGGAHATNFNPGGQILLYNPPCCRPMKTRLPCEPFMHSVNKMFNQRCPPFSGRWDRTKNLAEKMPLLTPMYYELSKKRDFNEFHEFSTGEVENDGKFFYTLRTLDEMFTSKTLSTFGVFCDKQDVFFDDTHTIIKSCCIDFATTAKNEEIPATTESIECDPKGMGFLKVNSIVYRSCQQKMKNCTSDAKRGPPMLSRLHPVVVQYKRILGKFTYDKSFYLERDPLKLSETPKIITNSNKPVTATTTKTPVRTTTKATGTTTTSNKPVSTTTTKKPVINTTKKTGITKTTKSPATTATKKGKNSIWNRVKNGQCSFRVEYIMTNEKRSTVFDNYRIILKPVKGIYYGHKASSICCKSPIENSTEEISFEKRTSLCCIHKGIPKLNGMRTCSFIQAFFKFNKMKSTTKENKGADAQVIKHICPEPQKPSEEARVRHLKTGPKSAKDDQRSLAGFTDRNGTCADPSKKYHIFFREYEYIAGNREPSSYRLFDWCCSKDIFADYSLDPSKLCCGLGGAHATNFNPGGKILAYNPPCCRPMKTRLSCEPYMNKFNKLYNQRCPPLSGRWDRTRNLAEKMPLFSPMYYELKDEDGLLKYGYFSYGEPENVKKWFYTMRTFEEMFQSKTLSTFGLFCDKQGVFWDDADTIIKSCCIDFATSDKNKKIPDNTPSIACDPKKNGFIRGNSIIYKHCQRHTKVCDSLTRYGPPMISRDHPVVVKYENGVGIEGSAYKELFYLIREPWEYGKETRIEDKPHKSKEDRKESIAHLNPNDIINPQFAFRP